MERITVILPARNAEKTVCTAVSSTLRGLPHDGRLLVLDDASDDTTSEILRRLARADGRIGVITSDVNLGVSEALNVLIDAADTSLIARMDADDIALPWRFRQQIAGIIRGTLDVTFSPIIHFGSPPAMIKPQPPLSTGPTASPYELLLRNPFAHSTLLGRRSTLVSAGGYRRVPMEDWDLWIRMVLRGSRFGKSALPTLLYRRHAQQVSASEGWRSAHGTSVEATEAHQELSHRLLGFSAAGAFAALNGSSSAGSKEVDGAAKLIKAVRTAASSFPRRDRLSIGWTAAIASYKLRRVYGAN
jgi:glycosyltransferase involved in cell wall biosynthesis